MKHHNQKPFSKKSTAGICLICHFPPFNSKFEHKVQPSWKFLFLKKKAPASLEPSHNTSHTHTHTHGITNVIHLIIKQKKNVIHLIFPHQELGVVGNH